MIGDVPNAQSLCRFHATQHIHKQASKKKITSAEVEKKGSQILFSPTAKEDAQQLFSPAAKNATHPKSRVALCATSLAAAVAQNGYFDPNVAPAQQRNT